MGLGTSRVVVYYCVVLEAKAGEVVFITLLIAFCCFFTLYITCSASKVALI